jgi:hypothetical protein
MVAGTTDWSPSLGGTLIAAIDDLRHLVGRAEQFSDEDSEHLHHRATELSVYVRATTKANDSLPFINLDDPPAPGSSTRHQAEQGASSATSAATPVSAPAAPVSNPTSVKSDDTPRAAPPPVVPISQLFYADAGPHVVSGGVPAPAADRSDLLGRGIDALDTLTSKPLARPIVVGVTSVVPVETLLYRGRAALERAAEIREQIKSAGAAPPAGVLDEMYDLIGLALKD